MAATGVILVAALALVPQAGAASSERLVVVANHPAAWGESLELVEELRIGQIDEDPAYTFGRVTGFAEAADGSIWVADALLSTIHRYGADGQHIADLGRRGEGPGEFSDGPVLGVHRLADGRMAVFDVYGRRVTLFSGMGEYLLSWTPDLGCITSRRPGLIGGDSDILFLRTCVDGADAWVAVDSEGVTQDTLMVPPLRTEAAPLRRMPFGAMAPYIPKTVSALSPRGQVVSGRTDDYAVEWALKDGRTVRIERDWEPVAVLPEERAQARDHYERAQQLFQAAGVRTDPPFRDIPADKPPFWALFVDRDERIWVVRHEAGHFEPETPGERAVRTRLRVPGAKMEWREELVTDVLEPNGRFLGTVRFPNERSAIASASGDVVWVVEHGEYDEQYIVKYRIDRH